MSTSDGSVVGLTKIVDNGPASRRWNLVILAEGYRQAELAKFATDAQAFVNLLFATPPFDVLRYAINVYRVDVRSTDSGADDPAGGACGGTGAVARTYFDATFCASGLPRLLTSNSATAVAVAVAQVPEYHQAVVIVNSNKYGGAGGSVATFSTAPGSALIGIHELGHSAFGLADEYEYWRGCGSGETDRNNYSGAEPAEANVTANATATIKWKHLLTPGVALPTSANPNCAQCHAAPSPVAAGTVGAFEGARYFHCGAYRPEFDCKMRTLSSAFCRVCRTRIHATLTPFTVHPIQRHRDTWTTGWTHFMPFELGGDPHYLAYKTASGDVAIDRVRADYGGVVNRFADVWSSAWSHFMPLRLGGEPHYLAYRDLTGDAVIDRIRNDASGVDTVFQATWSKDWTTFMPFLLGGQPHYLAYKASTGEMSIDRVRPDGSGVDTVFADTWSTGWTTFVPFELGGQPHYLAYKIDTGQVSIDRIRRTGQGVDTLFGATWSPGWSHFAPFVHRGHPHYMAYKGDTGQFCVDRIKDGGTGVITLFGQFWSQGWSTFLTFPMNGEPHHLVYKTGTGDVSIGSNA